MLHRPCAPQPLSQKNFNIRVRVVNGAEDILPEGGVAAQAGIVGGEYLVIAITWISCS